MEKEQYLIDGGKCLKPEQITEFCNYTKDGEDITIQILNKSLPDPMTITCKMDRIIDSIFDDAEVNAFISNDDDEIFISCEDACLYINGLDYRWWKESLRRLNKLKRALHKEEIEKKSSSSELNAMNDNEISLAIADLTTEGLVHIDFTTGKKSDVINWMNKQIVAHYDKQEESVEVFCLNFTEDDVNNLERWHTLDELVGMGKIVLR